MNISNFPKSDTPITLPDDLSVRPVKMDDLETAVALMNRVAQQEYGQNRFTMHDVRAEWTSPYFNLATDAVGIWGRNGDMVGYCEFWRVPAERMRFWMRVDAAYDLNTLGRYLLNWAEAQAQAELHKTPEGVQVVLQTGNKADVAEVEALFSAYGYRPNRHFYLMRIDLSEEPPPISLPDGFSLQAYQHPEDIEKLVIADREAFRDHWGFVDLPLTDEMKQLEHWFDEDKLLEPALTTFVIDDATGMVAGFLTGRLEEYANPDAGYIEMLGVLRAYRKRGLGNALLRWAFRELYLRGKSVVTLHVDAGSLTGALRLYEKAGMRVMETSTNYEKVLRGGVSRMTTTVEDKTEGARNPNGSDE